MVDSAPDGVVRVGPGGVSRLVNAQTEQVFGYGRDDVVGRRVEILIPERFRDRHPLHRDGYVTEPHVRGMGAGLELHGRRKDGSEFPIEISLSPLHTDDGLLVSAAVRDITARKRADEL